MKYAIALQTGIVIDDCESKLAEFCQKDASYRRYDLPPDVKEDNELIEKDIQFANRMGARMGPLVIKSVVDRRKAINSALACIVPSVSISDPSIPWIALEQLFTATLGPEVGPARVTKILHKKRPKLIPILDSVVVSYCKVACNDDLQNKETCSVMISYVKRIKDDINKNLDALKEAIQVGDLKLTVVRAFDILLWAYSETYETTFGRPPVWKREGRAVTN
jgi:hypothetical protein